MSSTNVADATGITVMSDGPIRTVVLDRPEALNAVTAKMHQALADIWRTLADDAEARVVILTGAGRAFSAGGDFDFMTESEDAHGRWRVMDEAHRIILGMLHFPLPVVAAVNGPAVGLGCSLAMMSDIVLMSEKAFFADPHVAVGLVAGDGGAATLPAHMSLLHAKEFLFLGDRIRGDQAVAMGMANRVVPHDELLDQATALAARLAELPYVALRDTKRALNQGLESALASTRNYAVAAERYSMTDDAHQAFVASQRSKG